MQELVKLSLICGSRSEHVAVPPSGPPCPPIRWRHGHHATLHRPRQPPDAPKHRLNAQIPVAANVATYYNYLRSNIISFIYSLSSQAQIHVSILQLSSCTNVICIIKVMITYFYAFLLTSFDDVCIEMNNLKFMNRRAVYMDTNCVQLLYKIITFW